MRKLLVCLFALTLSSYAVSFAATTLSPADLGVDIRVSAEEVFPGDTVYVYVDVYNPTEETYYGIPLFVLMWCGSPEYNDPLYFPPTEHWQDWHAGDVRYYTIDVPPGITEVEVIPSQVLGDSVGDVGAPFTFFTGMSNPFFTAIFGSTDVVVMYWHF